MAAIPFPTVADTEPGAGTPPHRPSAFELEQAERAATASAQRRRSAATASRASLEHQRALQNVAALARTDGFESGRKYQREIARLDRWYWVGVGVAAGMVAFGLLMQLGRYVGLMS